MSQCDGGCKLKDLGLLAMRLMLSVVFVYHGSQKVFGWGGMSIDGFAGMLGGMGVPQPHVAAWVSSLTELVGGALLGVGFLSRLVAIPMAFNMYVAALMVHRAAFGLPSGMEYALTLAVFLTGLALTGPGHFSVDGCVFCGRRKSETTEAAALKK